MLSITSRRVGWKHFSGATPAWQRRASFRTAPSRVLEAAAGGTVLRPKAFAHKMQHWQIFSNRSPRHFCVAAQAPRRKIRLRWFVGGVLGLVVIGCVDRGFRRCVQFWIIVCPLFAHYLWVDKVSHPRGGPRGDEERAIAFDRLHARYSPIVRRATLHMRGFYLKAAQLVSMRDDYLPEIYLEWTRKLQDEAPMVLSSDEAKAVLAQELGLDGNCVDGLVSDWHETPIGIASIGQVYKARLRSTGQWIAVKVQMPDAEKIFRADIKCLQLFTYMALPFFYENMCQIEKQFAAEFDYLEESRSLEAVRQHLLPNWGHKIYIPRPIPELTSRRVLAMELLQGEKLIDAIRRRMSPLAEREGKTVEEYEREQYEALRTGKRKAETVASLRRKMAFWRWWRRLTFARDEEPPVDLADVFATIMAVQGQGVLRDGCFNADPHPGNILVLEDGKTLGLIDFGQLIRVPLDFRLKLASLVMALSNRDSAEVARLERHIGVKRKHYKEDVQYRVCSFWLDRDTDDVMQGMNLFEFMTWGELEDAILDQPDGYYMACRCSLIVRSMALAFGVRLSTSDYWRPHAEALLREHGKLA